MKSQILRVTLNPKLILNSDSVPTKATVGGELGERLEHSLRHLMVDRPFSKDYFYSQITGDETRWKNFPTYHGDTAGRYLWCQVLAESANDTPSSGFIDYLEGLVALQNEDGSFGFTQFEDVPLAMGKAYGNAWMLKGLSECGRIFGLDTARESATRLFGFIDRTFETWRDAALSEDATGFYAVSPSCYFHSFDGLMSYYAMTGGAGALELAGRFLPHLIPLADADHSHMYLTARRGVLEYLKEAGDDKLLDDMVTELDYFWEKHVLAMGGVPERLVEEGPADEHMDEACSLCDWYLVCMRLWDLTKELRWLERGVLALENALYFNQVDNGGFGSRCIGLDRYLQFGKEGYWCCSLFGPTALAMAGVQMVRREGAALVVDHLVEGEYQFDDGAKIGLLLDREGKRFEVDLSEAPSISEVRLAQPHWLSVKSGQGGGNYAVLAREAGAAGVVFEFDWTLWHSDASRSPERLDTPDEGSSVGIFFGPWMMASRGNGGDQVALALSAEGWGEGYSLNVVRGMPSCSESLSLCLPADIKYSEYDLFLLPSDKDGTLRLYPLKDKESPDMVRISFSYGLKDAAVVNER